MKIFGNLTFILNNRSCNKQCPFCIAKGSNKIYNKININNEFDRLEQILSKLEEENIKINRFVLSGNGEPSLYEYAELQKIVFSICRYKKLFKGIRIHTSGNIFFEKQKFELFNNLPNVEFNILRISLNNEEDMKILKYEKNYLETKEFGNAKNVKCDIALTNILNKSNFYSDLIEFVNKNKSVKIIRLKELLCSENDSKEKDWIIDHKLTVNEVEKIKNSIILDKQNILEEKVGEKYFYNNEKIRIIYGETGDFKYYNKDLIISNNCLMNYQEEVMY